MKPLITIISECHSDNLGDQAIARSLSNILHPFYSVTETSFGCLTISQTDNSALPTKLRKSILRKVFSTVPAKTRMRIWWHILGKKRKFAKHFGASIKESDLVVVGGGQLIKNNLALFSEKLSLISDISNSYSTPFGLLGVGVDKKMDSQNWRIVKKAINKAKFITLRDFTSRDRLDTAVNLERDFSILPDLAFALKNPEFSQEMSDRSVSLAINIMDFDAMLSGLGYVKKPDANIFVEGLCDIVKIAHNNGSTIKLFTSGTPEDLIAANNVKTKISMRTGVDVPIFHPSTLSHLLNFLVDVDDVIATRMHAGILSYISGCNPLCVNWDDKVAGVWSTINQPERVVSVEDIANKNASEIILRGLQNLAPASQHSLDELAEKISLCVLEPIRKTLVHDQASVTLKT